MKPAVAEELMTAEEFIEKYGHCSGVELVRGKVVWAGQEVTTRREFGMAKFRHGVYCNNAARLLTDFVRAHDLGWVAINDSFFPTSGDTVRGADVLYVSYARVPKTDEPPEDLRTVPDLAVEVRSPSDRWQAVLGKAIEYIEAGVPVVVIFDPKTKSASVFRSDDRQEIFEADQDLVLPDVLPGFAVPVRKFFE